ncbi:peptide MFS transporter [Cellulomonas denverensis]|uniref:Peptide MFS transporter n=1 Tax=Cellulomonas denverensis TaxID=264297 RepID=A0A7X6KXA4_9CELL|nr:peptide MFS transporter [Cellulomonas denverensis]NKY23916.1 peptide MFS transporter [Cellulomonas denverensis]GIG24964.1 MFS transporter [Cellulomonas denverensis]
MTAALPAPEKTFFGHPRALSTLFFVEMWERFSYYGMRALLVLYLVQPLTSDNPGLDLDDGVAKAIYGTYSGLVYLTPLAGGWIADRLIGLRRAVLWGGIVIASGHFLMAVPAEPTFWVGLLAIALGTGLLKPNISGMVGKLYAEGDDKRDAGFSLFYMGINLGSFVAPLICGWLGQGYNWHLGFGAAGVGMTLGLVQYAIGRRRLHGVGDQPELPATARERRSLGIVAVIVVVGLGALITVLSLLGQEPVTAVTSSVSILILVVPVWYFWQILRGTRGAEDPHARRKVTAFIWLFAGAAVFWMVFEQSGSTLSLFAEQVTNLSVTSGFAIPASWMQSVEPLFVIIFAPVFSAIWLRWGARAPRTSVKFALALVIVGASFLVLILPMSSFNDDGTRATVWWLVGVYLLQTWGELLLSPNGLSATTRLAPAGSLGQFLALWFLATSVGTTIGGQIAGATDDDPVLSFALCGGIAVLFGLVMFGAVKRINALMADVH